MTLVSTENTTNALLFFIGCYVLCVSSLIYSLVRLLRYHLRQKRFSALANELIDRSSTTTTVLVNIHKVNELDSPTTKSELSVFQPLIVRAHGLPLSYAENWPIQPPPKYDEHVECLF